MKNKKILIYFILYAIHIPQASLAGSGSLAKFIQKKFAKITHTQTTKKHPLKKNYVTSKSSACLLDDEHLPTSSNYEQQNRKPNDSMKTQPSISTPNLFKERILSSIDSGTQLKNKYSPSFGVYLILNDTNKTNSESNLYRLKDFSMPLPECLEESEKKGEEKPDTFEQPNLTSNLCTLNELSMSLPDLFEKLEEKSKKKPASNPYLSTKKQKTKDYHPKRYISTEKLYATEVLIDDVTSELKESAYETEI